MPPPCRRDCASSANANGGLAVSRSRGNVVFRGAKDGITLRKNSTGPWHGNKMLQTRLWMGTVLVLVTAGMLVFDQRLAPWFPFLLVFVLGLSLAACHELVSL